MQLYEYKPFQKQVTRLARQGGDADMAYRQVVSAINNWRHDLPVTLPRTKNGETRIPHAVKYDLQGAHRLVTVEHENARVLVYVGSHDDAERWLDMNRGAQFVVNKRGQIEFTRLEPIPLDPAVLQDTLPEAPRLTGPVLRLLPAAARELLNLPRKVALSLDLITFEVLLDNDTSWEIIHAQDYLDDAQRSATLDAIDHLRHGRVTQALARIEAYAEEATASPEAVVAALEAGTATDVVANLTALSDADFEHRFRNSGYTEWLLFMHPEQRKHVDASHGGPARLLGVSGSGKTCVLVHRANQLASRYPGEKILVLVLNESLRQLLTSLVEHLCPEPHRKQIEIMRIYDFCYKVVRTINPRAVINPVDEISGEDLATCWRDFTNRPHANEVSSTLRSSIKATLVEPWGYLHDELIWVRTGTGGSRHERKAYLTAERRGRSLQFPLIEDGNLGFDDTRTASMGFRADARARVLALLDAYEEYMAVGGLLDEDGVALMAYEYRDRIAEHPELRARCVLVDEVQDCSTTQLGVIARIPTSEQDGLFLVGDPVQKVFPRQQHLKSAGVNILGRAARLNTNYRNTREILDAAYPIINAYRKRSPVPEDEILEPELACRNGPRPKLITCTTAEEQWECVEFLIGHLRETGNPSICIGSPRPAIRTQPWRRGQPQAVAQPLVDESLLSICQRRSWPVMGIEGRVRLDKLSESVVGARFEDMKGFEFKNVLLVDLHDRRLVSPAIPADEHWRIAFQVYVAMTRAQESLWMFAIGDPSQLLRPLGDNVDRMTAQQLMGREASSTTDGPTRLDAVSVSDGPAEPSLGEGPVEAGAEAVSAAAAPVGAGNPGVQTAAAADEEEKVERLELPFDPQATSTVEMLRQAEDYRDDPEIFEQIMLQLNERDLTAHVTQVSRLREHWLMLVRREGNRELVKAAVAQWPVQAVVGRTEGLSGSVFPYAHGMLSFMGYSVGAKSELTAPERRAILTYVYFGQLPRLIDDAYMAQWGTPGSRRRLIKMKNAIMAFIRNAQRRGESMAIAIREWQEDLRFIYETFG